MKIRADRYSIASASALCPRCARWTHVVALVVPRSHDVAGRMSLFYVTEVSASVARRLASVCPWYRQAPGGPQACLSNHCEHCALLLEDHDLHCEPGGAFQPRTDAEARGVTVWDVDEPLEGDADGFGYEPAF
jgi:hypothetical protein